MCNTHVSLLSKYSRTLMRKLDRTGRADKRPAVVYLEKEDDANIKKYFEFATFRSNKLKEFNF